MDRKVLMAILNSLTAHKAFHNKSRHTVRYMNCLCKFISCFYLVLNKLLVITVRETSRQPNPQFETNVACVQLMFTILKSAESIGSLFIFS